MTALNSAPVGGEPLALAPLLERFGPVGEIVAPYLCDTSTAVAEAMATLEEWGCRVLPTGEGRLACGTVGYGRLLEPEATVALIQEAEA